MITAWPATFAGQSFRPSCPGWFVRPGKPVKLPLTACLNLTKLWCVVEPGTTRNGTPGAGDVGLLAEVAYLSLAEDRAMVAVYGQSGIPIYWILNLVYRQVEVYSSPQPTGYAMRTDYRSAQQVPVVLDGTVIGQIAVEDLLP